MLYLIIIIIGYLLGNISTSYFVGKYMGKIDVREHGSGNLGTTNTLRVMGAKPGAIVFVGDIIKGILATLIGFWIKGDIGGLVGGFAAVIGHNWPAFLGFKGGKGIATSFGTILVLFPKVAIVLALVEAISIYLSGYVSLGSILAAILLPILVLAFNYRWAMVLGSLLFTLMAIFRHKDNIRRLLDGTENQFGSRGRR